MEKITVTQNGAISPYVSYVFERVKERFSFLPAKFDVGTDGERARIEFRSEKKYRPYIQKVTRNYVADVLVIGYKYRFFDGRLHAPLLDKKHRKWLLTALTAADYEEDYSYVLQKVGEVDEYAIDGVYHFRLKALRERWEGVLSYVTPDFSQSYLESFLRFFIDESEGKAYLKDGVLYDGQYRTLSKSVLLGEYDPICELLLCGAKTVHSYDEKAIEFNHFLRKYYGKNAVFC